MSTEVKQDHGLQIAHILFIDIVGYSKLLSDKQRELFQLLNELVRSTAQFRAADVAGKLVRLPTGDGMVLAFFTSVDAPVRCAQEIARKLRRTWRAASASSPHEERVGRGLRRGGNPK